MADHTDGSIIIDTELDNDGFEKGSGKLLDAVKDLTNAVDNLGDNMMQSFGRITPLLSSIAGSVSQITGAMKSEATQVTAANEEIIASEQRVASSAQQAAGAISASNGTAQTSTSSLERQINSINSSLESVSRSAETGFSSGSAVLSFDNKLNTLEANLSTAREQLAEFGNTKLPTAEYTELTQCIEKASKDLEALRERQVTMEDTGVKKNSRAWQTVEYQIQAVQRVLDDYKIDLAALESSNQAFVMGSDTEEFARMTRSVDEAAGSLERNRALIDSEALAQARLNAQAAQEGVIRAQTASQREAAMQQLASAQQNLNELATSMSNRGTSTGPRESDISAWQRFGNVVKTAGSAALKAASNIAKLSVRAAANGIKSLTSRLKSFISSSKSAANHANILTKTLTSLKTMLKSRIKRMFISSIISNVKEGLKDLASYDSTFNTSMSNIKNGAKELTSNLSVTLGRLIQTVEPVLTKIINAASTAVSYFNAFFALLRGQSTVTIAKKQMASYADSVDKTSDAISELKNQVYGFDKLNKRNSETSNAASNAANLYETVNIDDFLPDSLSSIFNKIKTLISNNAWNDVGKLIGQQINKALLKVNNYIKWDKIGAIVTSKVKVIASLFNGFVSTINWDLLGDTLAQGFNTIINTAYLFLTSFNWGKFSRGLGKAVKSFIQKVDWSKLGLTLSRGFSTLFTALSDFINELDGKDITDAISNFIKGALDIDWVSVLGNLSKSISNIIMGMDFGDVSRSLSKVLSTALRSLSSAVENFDWGGLGTKIADFVNNIDWVTLFGDTGKLVSNITTGLLSFLTDALGNINIRQFGKDLVVGIKELIKNIDWTEIVSLAFELLGQAIALPVNLAIGIVEGLYDCLKEGFEGAKDYFKPYIDEAGGNIAEGILNGIKAAIDNAGDWLHDNVLMPLLNGLGITDEDLEKFGKNVEKFFTQDLPEFFENYPEIMDSVMTLAPLLVKNFFNSVVQSIKNIDWSQIGKEIGNWFATIQLDQVKFFNNLWEQLKAGWPVFWAKVGDFFRNLPERLKEFYTHWTQIGVNIIKGLFEGLATVNQAIKNFIDGFIQGWKNGLGIHSPSTVFEEIGRYLVTGLLNGIIGVWNGITTFFSTGMDNVKSGFSTAWTDIKTNASTAWEGIKSALSGKWEGLKTTASTAWGGLKTTISTGWENIKTSASTAWEGIKNALSGKWDGINNTASSKFNTVKSTIQNKGWSDVGTSICSGIQNGINTGWQWLSTTVSTVASGLLTTAKNVLGIHSPSKLFRDEVGMNIGLGIGEGIKGATPAILSDITDITNAIAKEMNAEIPAIELTEDGMVSGINTVATHLSGIVTVFKDIANMLAAAGGFTVPQIAAGTIVPAKTRIIASSGDTNGAYGLPAAFTDGVDEQLDDITMLLRQIIALIKALNLNIDIDALTNMITRRQKSNARNYGGNV